MRRSAGAVERDGLENRCGGDSTQGSNPCSSAKSKSDKVRYDLKNPLQSMDAGFLVSGGVQQKMLVSKPFCWCIVGTNRRGKTHVPTNDQQAVLLTFFICSADTGLGGVPTMGGSINKLTDLAIKNAKPGKTLRRISDGGGLFLEIRPNGSRYWRLAYRFDKWQKLLALGGYPRCRCRRPGKIPG